MKIKLNIYKKKDDTYMIYANNDRGVSVGIAEQFPAKYGKFKLTDGQIRLLDSLHSFINFAETVPFNSGLSRPHEELSFSNALGTVYITDTATVCGQPVGADGAYLFSNGKLINLGFAVTV